MSDWDFADDWVQQQRDEVKQLRARVAELETQLATAIMHIPRGSGIGGQTITDRSCVICEFRIGAASTAFEPVCMKCRTSARRILAGKRGG